ncbi:gamma-glutamylcyclotransferase family protein [Aureimonas psammosilenae]|uniref:gamma-glutamylcyclotransferase family protein n=1 Tax=Aureimonas psammosilenae TaxID=2495496 RepID=UPI001869F004|nr:gamma-glutamylcyclotransferase family protein [Aureimonas psammosilenae]
MLYFAYGSNLNRAHFCALCPAATAIGKAKLFGYRLVFKTFADIEPCLEGKVEGALWRVTAPCETALDRYEEIASGLYERRIVEVLGDADGRTVEAFTYRMTRQAWAAPSTTYLKLIEDGYRDFGLDMAALRFAMGRDQETPGQYATRPDA